MPEESVLDSNQVSEPSRPAGLKLNYRVNPQALKSNLSHASERSKYSAVVFSQPVTKPKPKLSEDDDYEDDFEAFEKSEGEESRNKSSQPPSHTSHKEPTQ
jgi:hypothetical protein